MTDGLTLLPGDVLKIERRFLVDGVVQKKTDQGVFAGVQVVGSSEHIVLQKGKKGGMRLVPLHSVAEITLVKAMPRQQKVVVPTFDPSVG